MHLARSGARLTRLLSVVDRVYLRILYFEDFEGFCLRCAMDVREGFVASAGKIEPWEIFVGHLIHSLCLATPSDRDGSENTTRVLEKAVSAEYAMDSLLLDIVLCGESMSAFQLYKAVQKIEGAYSWSSELLQRCGSFIEHRISALREIVQKFLLLLDEGYLAECSIFGLALRSLTIRYRSLNFEEVCRLFDDVRSHCEYLIRAVSEEVDQQSEEVDLLDHAVSEEARSSSISSPSIDWSQISCSRRNPLAPHPISFFSSWPGNQKHQQSLQPRLDAYMQSLAARDWPESVRHHHDYFDGLPLNSGEAVAEASETEDRMHHEHLCRAVLQLCFLHDKLNHPQVSKDILHEAIGLAQVSPDATLLARALGALQLASQPGSMESGALADMFLTKAREGEDVETHAVAELRKAWHGLCAGGVRPGTVIDHLLRSVDLCQEHRLHTILLQARNLMSVAYRIFGQNCLSQMVAQLVLRWQIPSTSNATVSTIGSSSWRGENVFVDCIEQDEREKQLCQATCQLARLAVAAKASHVGLSLLAACNELVTEDAASEARQLFQECRSELRLQQCVAASDLSAAARWLVALDAHNPLLARFYEGLLLKERLQLVAARLALTTLICDIDQIPDNPDRMSIGFHLPLLKARVLLALSEVELDLATSSGYVFNAVRTIEQCIALCRHHGLIQIEHTALHHLLQLQLS